MQISMYFKTPYFVLHSSNKRAGFFLPKENDPFAVSRTSMQDFFAVIRIFQVSIR